MQRYVSIIIVMVLIFGFAIGFSNSQGNAKEAKNFDSKMIDVGKHVKNEHKLFLDGLNSIHAVPTGKTICWVNGLPISNDELQMRLLLNQSSGTGPQTLEETQKRLIREKVIEKEAEKLGLIPSTVEINKFIAQEKEQMKYNSEFKDGVEKIISAWGLTEDEYWNVYERYNVYRILILDKLGRNVLNDFYSKDKITPDDEEIAKEKWDKYVEELLSKAEVKNN